MDAGVEFPEDREFRRPDLLGYVRQHRGQLVAAALTMLRAFHVADRPGHGKPAKGSFETWDALVRACIIWCEMPDPIETVIGSFMRSMPSESVTNRYDQFLILRKPVCVVSSTLPFDGRTARNAWNDPSVADEAVGTSSARARTKRAITTGGRRRHSPYPLCEY